MAQGAGVRQPGSLAKLTDTGKLFIHLLSSRGRLTKRPITTLRAMKVLPLTDRTRGSGLYVATTGRPHPIEIVKGGHDGRIWFGASICPSRRPLPRARSTCRGCSRGERVRPALQSFDQRGAPMNAFHRRAPDSTGRRRQPIMVLALLFCLAAISAGGTDASAAMSTVPRAPADLGATAANNGLQVEPATITYTGDGTGFLGGASTRRNSSINWTEWTAEAALGTGFNQLDSCEPSCARGAYHGYRVRIELWRPRALHGALVFTRMTILYVGSHPRGEPRHYTFTDTYMTNPGGFGWGPPSASYCTRTNGLMPATGCNNIHSLP
jgi:hypothetical protein